MAYFSNYYSTLLSLKETVGNDIKSAKDSEDVDDRLLASLVNFKKDVETLANAAANNSWIESESSLMK